VNLVVRYLLSWPLVIRGRNFMVPTQFTIYAQVFFNLINCLSFSLPVSFNFMLWFSTYFYHPVLVKKEVTDCHIAICANKYISCHWSFSSSCWTSVQLYRCNRQIDFHAIVATAETVVGIWPCELTHRESIQIWLYWFRCLEFSFFFVRFEVFTAVTMKNCVFWDVTPCGSCTNRRFEGT
jgi:hypothetical protein